MPTGPIVQEMRFRNSVMQMEGLAHEIGAVTTVSEAGTLNKMVGLVTTNTLDAAAGATETIVITNDKIAAGDWASATIVGKVGTGTPVISTAICTANTLTVIIQNIHASAAFTGALTIAFEIRKKLTNIVIGS